MDENKEKARDRVQELSAQFAERGDAFGWFDALYKESSGDNTKIPWADLEPNKYFKDWAEKNGLSGDGRTALVVGCGLGDDAVYLDKLGFEVTAFDISPTAIEWAKRLNERTNIHFEVADLFNTSPAWHSKFDFVLEIYTIQPLPLEMRSNVIDAIANFVSATGEIVVVTRGREDNEEPDKLPWPLSRRDLSQFEKHGLKQTDFKIYPPDEDGEPNRWVVKYKT